MIIINFVVCCSLFVVPLEGGMLKKATESEIPCFLAFVVRCLLFVVRCLLFVVCCFLFKVEMFVRS
jgi:hypothetical protein